MKPLAGLFGPRFLPFWALFAVLIASYPDLFVAGKTYHPGVLYPLGARVTGPSKPLPFHVELSTGAYYETPINEWARREFLRGEFPLWNPNQSLGGPALAQYSTRLFFPFQWIENLFGPVSYDLFLMLRQFLAGAFTYALAVNLGVPVLGGFLAAMAFMLSGVFTWFFGLEQFTNVAFVLPLLCLSWERLVNQLTRKRFLLASVSVFLVLVAGQPEVALYGMFFAFFFILVHSRRNFGWVLLSVLAGILLAAPQILVFLKHLPHAVNHLHEAGGSAGSASPTPSTLLRLILFPTLSTYPLAPRIYPVNGHWDSLGGYLGLLLPFLLLLGLFTLRQKRDWRLIFCTGFTLLVLGKNLGIPPFAWLGKLPLFDQVWSPRWAGPAWVFSSCLALALALKSLDQHKLEKWMPMFLAVIFLAACWDGREVISRGEFIHGRHYFDLENFPAYHWPSVYLPLVLSALLVISAATILVFRFSHPLWGLGLLSWVGLFYAIPRGLSPGGMYLLELFCLVPLFAAFYLARGHRWALWSISLPAGWLLVHSVLSTDGLPKRTNPYQPPAYADFLEAGLKDTSRVMGSDGLLYGNTAGALGLYELQGIWSLPLKEYFTFYWQNWREPVVDAKDWGYWFSGLSRVDKTLTRLEPEDATRMMPQFSDLGVRYFVFPVKNTTSLPHTRQIYEDNDYRILENLEAKPRAYLVESSPTEESVQITHYGADRVEIVTDTQAERQLILSDLYAPGWEAFVDGKRTEITKVNLVRAVTVPKGRSQVLFKYWPQGLSLGLFLFLLGSGMIVGVYRLLPKTEPQPTDRE